MKKILLTLLIINCLHLPKVVGQLQNTGKLIIQNGTSVVTTLDVLNTSAAATVTNDGTLTTTGNVTNQTSATLTGSGMFKLNGNWTNSATFTAATTTVQFEGNALSTVTSGGGAFNHLTLNKTANDVSLLDNTTVGGTLLFNADNNKLLLNTANLTIGTTGSISSYDNNEYVVTSSTGTLIQQVSGTAQTYPIGSNSTSYTPLSITQTGTAFNLAARVQDQVLASGTSGSALTTGVVNKTWILSEPNAAVTKNLSIMPQWNAIDELTLDPMKCGNSNWTGADWDLAGANIGTRSGAGPYTQTRSGITLLGMGGLFAVGGKPVATTYVQLSAKVFLQGAYSGGVMTDALRSAGLIPSTESTAAASGQTARPNGFVHKSLGGGEAASATAFSVQAPTTDNVVDWVFVELRDPVTSSNVLYTRAALLQKDGDIVNEDGTSPLKIYGVPEGNYYVSIKHRNHLAVRTANTKSLSQGATTVIDFTTNLAEALGSQMATPATGVYALWGGNANGDTRVRYSGPANDESYLLNTASCLNGNKALFLSNTYNNCDINMNSSLRYSGPNNDEGVLLNTILQGNKSLVVTQPTF